MTCFFDKFVYAFEFTVQGVYGSSLFNRLVGPGRGNLICNFSIKPVDSTAEGRVFREL